MAGGPARASHGQAAPGAGQRQADGHLAVVLVAQLAAVLAGHPHRVLSFLRETCVVHDAVAPVLQPEHRLYPIAHGTQHRAVRPLRLGNEVVQRLMARAHVQRIQSGRHGLDALARQRQHQAGAVPAQPVVPVRMTQPLTQAGHVAIELLGVRPFISLFSTKAMSIHWYPHFGAIFFQ